MSSHDDSIRVRHMLDYAREAVQLVAGLSQDDLGTERLVDLSLLHLITLIGEAAGRVSITTRQQNPQVP